jgi:hypothetical protein
MVKSHRGSKDGLMLQYPSTENKMKFFIAGLIVLVLSVSSLLHGCDRDIQAPKQIQDPVNTNVASMQESVVQEEQEPVVEEKSRPTPEEIPPRIMRQTVLDGRVTFYEVCVNGVMYYVTGQGSVSPAYYGGKVNSTYTCDDNDE